MKAIDSKEIVNFVVLDLSKAFDSISHEVATKFFYWFLTEFNVDHRKFSFRKITLCACKRSIVELVLGKEAFC